MIGRIASALLALGLLAACTSTPYPTPVIEPVQGAGPQAFAGLRELTDSGGVRALWTHGMCTHTPDWVKDRANRVSIALGLGPDAWTPPFSGGGEGPSYKLPRRFTVEGKALDIDFFVWSPLFARAKKALDFDAPKGSGSGMRPDGAFPYQRAELNNALKVELLNDCLADAVLYNGARSTELRRDMRAAVCATLDGKLVGDSCDVGGATDPRPVVFVTESLGSKFLFDAVRDLWNATGRRSATQQAALGGRLANVRMLFMLANQIPLLDLADADPDAARVAIAGAAAPAPSSLGSFLDIVAGAKRTRARTIAPSAAVPIADPLTVVAFTDPGDLLSYRLLAAKLARNPDTVRLFNVLASNGPIYFGLVQRPDTAHCGYAYNAYVIGLMVRGHHPGQPLPTVPVTGVGRC